MTWAVLINMTTYDFQKATKRTKCFGSCCAEMTFMRPFKLPEKDSAPLHKAQYDLGKIV